MAVEIQAVILFEVVLQKQGRLLEKRASFDLVIRCCTPVSVVVISADDLEVTCKEREGVKRKN